MSGYSVALGRGVFLFSIGGGAVSLMLVKGRGKRWGDGTEKPTGVVPCGLSGFHQINRVITDGDSGWLSESA